jgi:hypothetical protein
MSRVAIALEGATAVPSGGVIGPSTGTIPTLRRPRAGPAVRCGGRVAIAALGG